MGRGAPSSSNSKVKSSGFSPVVRNSGAMCLSMAGVGCIISGVCGLHKVTIFPGISVVADIAGDAGNLAIAQGQRCKSGIARLRPAMLYPHPVADAPFPPITGKRSSPLCTAVRRRIFPAHGASPTSPAPAISTKKAWFRPQPHRARL